MKTGIYYFKKDLRMIELGWINIHEATVMVWTYHDMKSGRGVVTCIPVKQFKKNFSYLGDV